MFLANVLIGQQTDPLFQYKNALKINPVALANAEFQMTYERYFKDRAYSLSIVPSIIVKDNPELSKLGFQLMGQYRIHLSNFNIESNNNFLGFYNYGFYAGVYGLYLDYQEDYFQGYYDETYENYISGEFEKDVQAGEMGALIGIQMDISARILIDFFVGGGVRKAEVNDTYYDVVNPLDYYQSYGVFDVAYTGVKPNIGLLLGITF